MCGIFGVVLGARTTLTRNKLEDIISKLFILSETRGKEAAGLAVDCGLSISVLKDAMTASKFIKTARYRNFLASNLDQWEQNGSEHGLAVIGHARLVTNGAQGLSKNNQPVIAAGYVGIHNGIIINDRELWEKHPECHRTAEVDSEVILALMRKYQSTGADTRTALIQTFRELDGTASIALIPSDSDQLILGTNNGSLYYAVDHASQTFVFTSERMIINGFLKNQDLTAFNELRKVIHLEPNSGLIINSQQFDVHSFSFSDSARTLEASPVLVKTKLIKDDADNIVEARNRIRRCTKCILPETFPFLEFDQAGVCSICRNYESINPIGYEALQRRVEPFRRNDGKPDCIVSISGGRDSSFGLHYIVKELKMKPVTYTYDWGLVTDLARRNISRLCGRLGIEHILISADIKAKRANVRRNINAWLKRPRLGMIPLFMAGDKQYFHYGHELANAMDSKLVFFFPNRLERTNFKSGFCGVDEGNKWFFKVSTAQKIKLLSYFGTEFLLNPSYLNKSLVDTAHAFYSTYFLPNDKFLFMFDYVPYDEDSQIRTLREEYGWEKAADTESTWRIGDGTASFYNFIYYTVAGFTEHDTFRSNQVREGLITRDQAMKMALKENEPRYSAIREYAQTIGFDCDDAIRVINAIPKLYAI